MIPAGGQARPVLTLFRTVTRSQELPTHAPEPGPVQSLARGLHLLELLAADEPGLTLTDLAQTAGLPPSTTHRLLKGLERRRFVHHDGDSGRWQVGVQAFTVGSAFVRGRNVVALARPFLRHLVDKSGETANLAVEDAGEAVYLAQVECNETMRAFARPGARIPMHCTAVGKALLAAASPDAAARVLTHAPLAKLTPRTLTDPQALTGELLAIRGRGFAVDDEEQAVGLRCVAATLHDATGGALAALSVSGPSARITDERLPDLGRLVAGTCQEISRQIGGPAPVAETHR